MPAKKFARIVLRETLSWFVALTLAVQFAPVLQIHAQNSGKPSSGNHENWRRAAVRAPHGMVATDEQLGSQAGVEIMKRGGNAIDSAVAVAFALAVVEPAAGNIGGGGFMLVRLANGKAAFLDYREVAPGKAARDMYLGADGKVDPEASLIGYRSVAVPGTVAGLDLALKTYGTMKLSQVMAPAIQLAEQGFVVDQRLAKELERERATLEPFAVSRRIFLNDGKLLHAGDTLRQPELAATLKRVASRGAAEFYRGKTARMLVDDMAHSGGIISLSDLAHYTPKIREVLRAKYTAGGPGSDGSTWEVLTSPPPSSGGIAIIEALNMLKDVPLQGWDDVDSVHMVAETMRRVFADRAAYLGDADFVSVPVAGLTDSCYAKEVAATIDPLHASSSKVVHAGHPHTCAASRASATPAPMVVSLGEGPHTTHFSVVDGAGNAVASTYTLNNSYGSHATSSAGFLLNDEMDDFTSQPGAPNLFGLIQSEANAIAPGHRPLSSMVPTILLRDGKLSFVTGSPGGPQIISATMLSIINWMRLGMDAQAAINAPRFHHQWLPDQLVLEEGFSDEMERALQSRGFTTTRRGHIGVVNAIGIDPKSGERLGAADPRHDGVAIGY